MITPIKVAHQQTVAQNAVPQIAFIQDRNSDTTLIQVDVQQVSGLPSDFTDLTITIQGREGGASWVTLQTLVYGTDFSSTNRSKIVEVATHAQIRVAWTFFTHNNSSQLNIWVLADGVTP